MMPIQFSDFISTLQGVLTVVPIYSKSVYVYMYIYM